MSSVNDHFVVSGGKEVCKLSNGYVIAVRSRIITFKGPDSEVYVPVSWHDSEFYLAEHYIIFEGDYQTFAFNCKDNSYTKLFDKVCSVRKHYVIDGDIYVMFSNVLYRMSDNVSIHLSDIPAIYLFVGNSRYIVLGTIEYKFYGEWKTLRNPENSKTVLGVAYKLHFEIYDTPTAQLIHSEYVSLDNPVSSGNELTPFECHKYAREVAKNIIITNGYIDVYGIRFTYRNPTKEKHGCVGCTSDKDLYKLQPCDHVVCGKCAGNLKACYKCKITVTGCTAMLTH